jgi:hypothetical protein
MHRNSSKLAVAVENHEIEVAQARNVSTNNGVLILKEMIIDNISPMGSTVV